jgi:hypothetical protein
MRVNRKRREKGMAIEKGGWVTTYKDAVRVESGFRSDMVGQLIERPDSISSDYSGLGHEL